MLSFIILSLISLTKATPPYMSPCSLSDYGRLSPPFNFTHHYFVRCVNYVWHGDNDLTATTMDCKEINFYNDNNSASIQLVQACGATWSNFNIQQTIVSNQTCADGMETSFIVSVNNIPLVSDSGCWDALQFKAYELSSFTCGNHHGETCDQWLSLDSFSGTISTYPNLLLTIFSIVLFNVIN